MKQSSKSKNARVGVTARALAALLALSAFLLLSAPHASAGPDKPVTHYVMAGAEGANNGTSWADAFGDLQDALDAAVSGDQIWVATGTYTPSVGIDESGDPRMASFIMKSGVAIYGGFKGDEKQFDKRQVDPGRTVLSGELGIDGDDTDNSYHVVYADGVTGAVLDGFTVTGGRGDGGKNYSNFQGGGMYNKDSALTVANCVFRDNQVAQFFINMGGWGGGMFNYNSAPIVTNCTFIANRAGNVANSSEGKGGGMYNYGYFGGGGDSRGPVVTGCTFIDNLASSKRNPKNGGGGGMYNDSCSPVIDRCTFTGNLAGCGGGMLNYLSQAYVTNCVFNANSSSYLEGFGGAMYNLGYAFIQNCTFHRNGTLTRPNSNKPSTMFGGAIFEDRVGNAIYNCVFSENAAYGAGGAVGSWAVRPRTTLTNCLFYKNTAWGDGYSPQINHLYGNVDEVDNLHDVDPLFVDAAEGDFHLRFDSPCIDAGLYLKQGQHYWPWPMPATDFDGGKRVVDGDGDGAPGLDIGADEYVPNIAGLDGLIQALADGGDLDQAIAADLLAYVGDAKAALDQEDKDTAISILNELIDDLRAALDESETAQLIENMTVAVIEEI